MDTAEQAKATTVSKRARKHSYVALLQHELAKLEAVRKRFEEYQVSRKETQYPRPSNILSKGAHYSSQQFGAAQAALSAPTSPRCHDEPVKLSTGFPRSEVCNLPTITTSTNFSGYSQAVEALHLLAQPHNSNPGRQSPPSLQPFGQEVCSSSGPMCDSPHSGHTDVYRQALQTRSGLSDDQRSDYTHSAARRIHSFSCLPYPSANGSVQHSPNVRRMSGLGPNPGSLSPLFPDPADLLQFQAVQDSPASSSDSQTQGTTYPQSSLPPHTHVNSFAALALGPKHTRLKATPRRASLPELTPAARAARAATRAAVLAARQGALAKSSNDGGALGTFMCGPGQVSTAARRSSFDVSSRPVVTSEPTLSHTNALNGYFNEPSMADGFSARGLSSSCSGATAYSTWLGANSCSGVNQLGPISNSNNSSFSLDSAPAACVNDIFSPIAAQSMFQMQDTPGGGFNASGLGAHGDLDLLQMKLEDAVFMTGPAGMCLERVSEGQTQEMAWDDSPNQLQEQFMQFQQEQHRLAALEQQQHQLHMLEQQHQLQLQQQLTAAMGNNLGIGMSNLGSLPQIADCGEMPDMNYEMLQMLQMMDAQAGGQGPWLQ